MIQDAIANANIQRPRKRKSLWMPAAKRKLHAIENVTTEQETSLAYVAGPAYFDIQAFLKNTVN